MTSNDLNQIRGVVKEEITSALEPIKETLAEHGKTLAEHGRKLDEHGKKLDEHGKTLAEHGRKLDALWDQTIKLTGEAIDIKEAIATQSNFLDKTNDNVKKLDKRLTATEARLGIVAAPELTVIN